MELSLNTVGIAGRHFCRKVSYNGLCTRPTDRWGAIEGIAFPYYCKGKLYPLTPSLQNAIPISIKIKMEMIAMYCEICENCKYQRYDFLAMHDTICPFEYDFATCYSYTKGEENRIDAYALITDSIIQQRMNMNINDYKIKQEEKDGKRNTRNNDIT